MQASRRAYFPASLGLLTLSLLAPRTTAETLKITSTPPGATVEIDGATVGVTPYRIDYPGGYFHKPHVVFATRLEHSMVARITLKGYEPRQLTISDGPFTWISATGKNRGKYWLLKSDHFEFQLEPTAKVSGSAFNATQTAGPLQPHLAATPMVGDPKPSGWGHVTITSDPASAEIYVDGKFMGQAPATLPLAAGSHHIEVKAEGRRSWTRDLEVLKDSKVSLHPVLSP
jgi:hypothetical protein